MATKSDLEKGVEDFFSGDYEITEGRTIPDVEDIAFGKVGRELELAMLFIDIKESTHIVDGFRRKTAARMYKSFLWGVTKIVRKNNGELRSFNGDGVLVAFNGDYKRTHAIKAAMQMKWFVEEILTPKMHQCFENNSELEDLQFSFGIGIDMGRVLVVRGGIRGENNNDLVWVGNATNYAVKLSALSTGKYHIYISADMYKNMNEETKFHKKGDEKINMWEARDWTAMDNQRIYRTSYRWIID